MIITILRKLKNSLIGNQIFANILSYIYVFYNKFYLKNDVDIYSEHENWIHKTSIGLVPSNKPIFNPETYAKKNFDIFFQNYFPQKDDIVVELGAGIGCETLFISKLIGDYGKIISLEPFDEIYCYLEQTVKMNNLKNVTILKKALFKNSDGIGFSSNLNHWLGGRIDPNSENKVMSISLNDLVKKE
ncbi:hypothetical protein OAH69_02890, partial [Candidatus Pelagibacter sp.]|nr:hypothetical protein [Candidatus Pelagibacter sp.]